MQYSSVDDYLDANTEEAYRAIESLPKEKQEAVKEALDFLKQKYKEGDRVLKMYEDAVAQTVSKEEKDKINNLYMTLYHNNVLLTNEWARECFKPKGYTMVFRGGLYE